MEFDKKKLSEKIIQTPNFKSKSSNKSIINFISILSISIFVIFIIFMLSNKPQPKKNALKSFGLIPENEDLDFTEEEHRQLAREVATQTMVLATNNGVLPLKATDQVVLFGDGTKNTIYGGWGSGEVYNKGTTVNMSPVTILQGIENKKDKFIYVKNEKGFLLGNSLTEDDIEGFKPLLLSFILSFIILDETEDFNIFFSVLTLLNSLFNVFDIEDDIEYLYPLLSSFLLLTLFSTLLNLLFLPTVMGSFSLDFF